MIIIHYSEFCTFCTKIPLVNRIRIRGKTNYCPSNNDIINENLINTN